MIFADTSGCFQHLPASFLPKLAPPGRSAGGTPHHNVMGPGRESTWQYCEGGVTYILVHQVSSYNQTHGLKQSTQVLGSYGRPVFLEIRPPAEKGIEHAQLLHKQTNRSRSTNWRVRSVFLAHHHLRDRHLKGSHQAHRDMWPPKIWGALLHDHSAPCTVTMCFALG